MSNEAQVALIGAAGTVVVALVSVLLELVRRQSKRLGEQGQALGEVREHVANSHTTNLRHDVDRVLSGLAQVLDGQKRHDGAIGGLREELLHERRERLALAGRVDRLEQ